MASFQDRVIGAMKLQASTFEEVENDATATSQAALVVLAASLSSGIGFVGLFGFGGMIRQTIVSLLGWAVGAAVIWLIGTRLMPGKNTQADWGQLLRVLGFAQSPGIFSIIVIIPILGWIASLGIMVWCLVAAVIGVRQALDYDDTLKAVIVCVLAAVAYWLAMMLLVLIGLGPRLYSY